MSLELGKVYDCKSTDLGFVPIEVQVRMFQGGRLRSVRYDGPDNWHVLDDYEMIARQEELLRAEVPKLVEEDDRPRVRLDLGCGINPRNGFEGVDLYSDLAKHRVDLFRFPWPWQDESVDEIFSAHFLEHVPAEFVREEFVALGDEHRHFVGQDYLFAVMDECYRILRPGSMMEIVVPNSRSDGAFQDPTHRRFWNENTFGYFQKVGRDRLGVPQYRTVTDFETVQLTPVGPVEIGLMHPEVQANKWRKEWNAVQEWHAKLRKPEKRG